MIVRTEEGKYIKKMIVMQENASGGMTPVVQSQWQVTKDVLESEIARLEIAIAELRSDLSEMCSLENIQFTPEIVVTD